MGGRITMHVLQNVEPGHRDARRLGVEYNSSVIMKYHKCQGNNRGGEEAVQ